jgi:hypothetical protein
MEDNKMSDLTNLVPPLELCKKIPAGEFEESCFVRIGNTKIIVFRRSAKWSFSNQPHYPAPTLQEILEELHKLQKDVFLKWSETAYHEWLVNAYTHNSDDYQAHDRSLVIAAIKVWLKLKGIENGE